MEPVKIDIYISDLLYSYDCVIVPDFGGFVANYSPAKIKEAQHQFLPPSKHVSFNKNLKNNDGLLTNHISQRREISFQEANQIIRAFVDQSLEGLKKGDKIKIDKIGTLYLDPEGNIQFNAAEHNDFLLDSFGLQSFRALPIERDTVEEKIQEKITSGEAFKKLEKRGNNVAWKVAATVFFLLASGLFLNQSVDTSKLGDLQYSFFSPSTEVNSRYSTRESASEISIENTDLPASETLQPSKDFTVYQPSQGEPTSLWIAPEIEEKVEEEKAVKIDNTEVAVEEPISSGLMYHVMGGCFSQYDNATGLTEKLKSQGFNAMLLGEYKNLHAVSYGSFARKEDAIQLLERVKEGHNSSAWLLEKSF